MKSSIACFVSAVSEYLINYKKFDGSISFLSQEMKKVTQLMEQKKLSII